jgi:hypothetical protein
LRFFVFIFAQQINDIWDEAIGIVANLDSWFHVKNDVSENIHQSTALALKFSRVIDGLSIHNTPSISTKLLQKLDYGTLDIGIR